MIRPAFVQLTIKQGETGPNAGQGIYTPPRNKAVIQDRLENLVEFVNDDEQYKLDFLIKMIIAHFQFVASHPFRDGNDRTGRIFNINYLINKGLLDVPILFRKRSHQFNEKYSEPEGHGPKLLDCRRRP